MRKVHNAEGERLTLRDLLSGSSARGLGDVNKSIATSERRRVRVYDPEVRFISLFNSLHLRSAGGEQSG